MTCQIWSNFFVWHTCFKSILGKAPNLYKIYDLKLLEVIWIVGYSFFWMQMYWNMESSDWLIPCNSPTIEYASIYFPLSHCVTLVSALFSSPDHSAYFSWMILVSTHCLDNSFSCSILVFFFVFSVVSVIYGCEIPDTFLGRIDWYKSP